jgi:hypothetical protein
VKREVKRLVSKLSFGDDDSEATVSKLGAYKEVREVAGFK